MKKTLATACLLISGLFVTAQTKVFKEIAGSVKTQFEEIKESGSVIGYLSLSQIEKTDKDSFNYVIQLLDENLNDIGEVKFRDNDLNLHSVSFEKDVLCLSFSKIIQPKAKLKVEDNRTYTQYFVNLNGEIIGKHEIQRNNYTPSTHSINVPGKGFIVFTGEDKEGTLLGFDQAGKLKWKHSQKSITPHTLRATSSVFGFFNTKDHVFEFFDVEDPKKHFSVAPETPKKKAYYSLLNAQNINDKLVWAGSVRSTKNIYKSGQLKKGIDKGLYVLEVSGPSLKETTQKVDYWGGNAKHELLRSNASYRGNKQHRAVFSNAVADETGDVYFYSTNLQCKTATGRIVASVLTLPILVPPFMMASLGYSNLHYKDGSIFKFNSKNSLTIYDQVETGKSGKLVGKSPYGYAMPTVIRASNAETKDAHFIVKQKDEYMVYDVKKKKARPFTVSKKGITSTVYSAKDGHVLVLEKDLKAKETKLSIVAL